MKSGKKYFVTVYQKYPIYEPAEGGYYYEGTEIDTSCEFPSRREAKEYINALYSEYAALEDTKSKYWFESEDHTYFGMGGKYIGEGWFAQIETKQGSEVRGWQPYS